MQSRFSVYMDMLESKGLGVMKRASRNKFSYKIHEATTFQKREDLANAGAYRDPNAGSASSKVAEIEAKANGRRSGGGAPVQPAQQPVSADQIRAYDAGLSPEESEAINNNPHQADNDKAIIDPHGKKTDAIMQSRQPSAPEPVQPAAPEPVQPAAPEPVQPAAPAQPAASAQPGMMDRFLSGVNKAGEKLGNFQDRAKAFSQRTGGSGATGDLSKLMKYGMFGQESLDKPAQIENLKQQFIQQGYPEAEAVKMATDTVNQAPVKQETPQDTEGTTTTNRITPTVNNQQTGVQTSAPAQTGVQTSAPAQTGVQTNTPTKTNDVLDQATIDTIDPSDVEDLKTIPDDQLDSAVQAVADGNKLDAAALRKFIDAQREAISRPPQ
jgi:hypothetical protein